ncbi:phage tail protein [Leuconostoc carnosum]|uniref:phage tail sheath family protein n=1 Tax=Leuconostoc TaxID=1243 RepID=UPI00123B8ECC|nr:phage tail sheath family protein [Leuconostoc carnosum]KAA8371104.1 phage tail protein [Leuconostoc carnosum]KAA8382745.1 phage tail protein [Leuconostoc carnosum]
MAGGNWTSQNKARPGAYVDVSSNSLIAAGSDTSRGVVFWIHSGSFGWGADGVTTVGGGSDFKALFGEDINSNELAALNEILKGAPKSVLVFNSNAGNQASTQNDVLPWNFTAKYAGEKGNNLKVSVYRDATDTSKLDVATFFGTELVNTQSVRNAGDLKSNAYLDVQVTSVAQQDDGRALIDAVTSTITLNLSGGTTVISDNLLSEINRATETLNFNVLTAAGADRDASIHLMIYNTIKSLRENDGLKVTGVVPGSDNFDYDYEGVSVIDNGVILSNGNQLPAAVAAGYFAGVSAAADINESLTYRAYPGAVDVVPRLSNSDTEKALLAGKVVFTARRDGSVVIEQDINSHHTYSVSKNQYFRKNRVLRVLDEIANNTHDTYESQFIGKVDNNAQGRDVFKSNRITYLTGLQAQGAIQNFVPDDITVEAGADKDAVVMNLAIQPTDAMEKLYAKITVQ